VHSDDDVLDQLRDFAKKVRVKEEPKSLKKNDKKSAQNAVEAKHKEQLDKLKQKLSTALKTIESQDLWIDVLNQKMESVKGIDQEEFKSELSRMEEQVEYFKAQAQALESRPGTMEIGQSFASAEDILAFKATIESLEERLQRYIEFRTQVIQALGMNVISATDDEIFQAIRKSFDSSYRPMSSQYQSGPLTSGQCGYRAQSAGPLQHDSAYDQMGRSLPPPPPPSSSYQYGRVQSAYRHGY
jgi:hypothetical protein